MEVQREQQQQHPLKGGQTWKLEHGYLQIVEMGKRLAHYRIMTQLNQHAAAIRLIGIVELLIFLKHTEATLLS
jgi:hypothetical protein